MTKLMQLMQYVIELKVCQTTDRRTVAWIDSMKQSNNLYSRVLAECDLPETAEAATKDERIKESMIETLLPVKIV